MTSRAHFTKIAEGIEVAPLLGEIQEHPELWNRHGYRKLADGTPHAAMSDIWLRYRPKDQLKTPSDYKLPHIPAWYPEAEFLPSAKEIALDLMARVRGEMLCGVLITKIPVGEGILPHIDDGWHVQATDKFYVSLRSAPGAVFGADDGAWQESIEPKPGEIWMFDNRIRHWVENRSPVERITLIVCIITQMFGRS